MTELSSHIEYVRRWATDGFHQCVNHGKPLPQDHPKGLVHGTEIAICSDKDSFYLPFFTRTQLYVLTNSVGLTQKIKDQALILKLGKSTSQEINPNCCPRVPGAPLETGNRDNCRLITRCSKRTKNNPPPFRVVRVGIEITTLQEILKKRLLNKGDDIKYKKVKCFAMGFAAVHFDQFLANLVRIWFGQYELD